MASILLYLESVSAVKFSPSMEYSHTIEKCRWLTPIQQVLIAWRGKKMGHIRMNMPLKMIQDIMKTLDRHFLKASSEVALATAIG